MNDIVDTFLAQALKIAAQYEGGQVAFADLTGLVDEFAATLAEQLSDLPESQRPSVTSALESRLEGGIKELAPDSRAAQALGELLQSLNRTPIY
ncbi:hypothetical protein [Candidimonas nitroreducens]|uniref:Uncharacterized protein n=1 Tax=Candidimonas nitroreducens TaxID=683354 RepID=A0A225M2Q6_9BURK|nr:hypothetical protein [Candidimonas nitroreducens]OWT55624.1 hypothetical protein CEY11_20045 [Candidimonas nitroreducens]